MGASPVISRALQLGAPESASAPRAQDTHCDAYGELESCDTGGERAGYPFLCSVLLTFIGLGANAPRAGTIPSDGVDERYYAVRRRTERNTGALRQRAACVDGRCVSCQAEYAEHGLDDLCRTEWALGVSEVRLDMIKRRLPGM